jgi:hypothetical protein
VGGREEGGREGGREGESEGGEDDLRVQAPGKREGKGECVVCVCL